MITVYADGEPVSALAYLAVAARHAAVHVVNLLAPAWLREASGSVTGDLASARAREADKVERQAA